jgi:hypothetical protein
VEPNDLTTPFLERLEHHICVDVHWLRENENGKLIHHRVYLVIIAGSFEL